MKVIQMTYIFVHSYQIRLDFGNHDTSATVISLMEYCDNLMGSLEMMWSKLPIDIIILESGLQLLVRLLTYIFGYSSHTVLDSSEHNTSITETIYIECYNNLSSRIEKVLTKLPIDINVLNMSEDMVYLIVSNVFVYVRGNYLILYEQRYHLHFPILFLLLCSDYSSLLVQYYVRSRNCSPYR